ncbi:MAG: hypothetical protein M3413_00930 [Bacteroidota bacterium]|nr:hypothetical protein [Bacteroidota bacterium]
MKNYRSGKFWLLLLLAPFFIQGVCNKDNEDLENPNEDEYVTWNISGANGSLSSTTDSLGFYKQDNSSSMYGMTKTNPRSSFDLSFNGLTKGTYPAEYFNVSADGKNFTSSSTPLQVNISTYGSSGGYVTGTYNGNIQDAATSAIIAVNGKFHLKIKN